MAAKFTRLTHKIATQPHLVAENSTICSSYSRRLVRKLLDTPSYVCIFVCMCEFISTIRPSVHYNIGSQPKIATQARVPACTVRNLMQKVSWNIHPEDREVLFVAIVLSIQMKSRFVVSLCTVCACVRICFPFHTPFLLTEVFPWYLLFMSYHGSLERLQSQFIFSVSYLTTITQLQTLYSVEWEGRLSGIL
jgi:hypothetical protein